MRIFWAAIGILLLATAALIVFGADGSDEGVSTPSPSPERAAPAPSVDRAPAPRHDDAIARDEESVSTEVRAFNLPIDQVRKHFQANEERAAGEALAEAVTNEPEPVEPEPAPTTESYAAIPEDEIEADLAEVDQKAEPAIADRELVDAIVSSIMDEPAEANEPEAPADLERPLVLRDEVEAVEQSPDEQRDDGGRLLDGRFVIAGAGTPDDPYIVNWSLLSSASETFDPRMGKTELPERIKMLNGAHVRITGFVAFPFMVQESSELLMMQNQWDGCCLGVPPTAYDAIEVTLKDPANRLQRMMDYGSVEGVLKVDPYVRGNWLISLYMMENAQLAPEM